MNGGKIVTGKNEMLLEAGPVACVDSFTVRGLNMSLLVVR